MALRRPRNWSYRKELNERVANDMMAAGYSPTDRAAISLITSMVMDDLERRGWVTRAESDRLSQDVTIREVRKIMLRNLNTGFEPRNMLNHQFMGDWPTAREVSWEDIEVIDNAHARFRGRIYGTKENLRFRPGRVRLVDIGQ